MENKENIGSIIERPWYRLFRVLSILTMVVSIFFIIMNNYWIIMPEDDKYVNIDRGRTRIICDNGNEYNASEVGFDFLYKSDISDHREYLIYLCANGSVMPAARSLDEFFANKKIEGLENYKVRVKYQSYGFILFLKKVVPLVVGLFIFLELVKRIFYFIALGRFFPRK
jgi:hypothetical protein